MKLTEQLLTGDPEKAVTTRVSMLRAAGTTHLSPHPSSAFFPQKP